MIRVGTCAEKLTVAFTAPLSLATVALGVTLLKPVRPTVLPWKMLMASVTPDAIGPSDDMVSAAL